MGTFIKKFSKFDKSLRIKKRGMTITVSGLSGSGKSTVAEPIARALRFKLVNAGDIFRQIAKEKRMKLEEFSKIAGPEIDYEIERRMLKLAKEGNVVLIGRLAGFTAGNYADWKIFVDCPLDIRAERIAKRENKSIAKAKKGVIKRDKMDAKRYMKLYRTDDSDKRIYDIIINTGYISKKETEQRAKHIVCFLIRK